jgi:hypothetical protein
VGWLLGLDLARMVDSAIEASPVAGENEIETLASLGLLDATTLIVERHDDGQWSSTDAVLEFDGPRRGMAAWLAEPAPMGSLDFISPEASLAGAVVTKDAIELLDDLLFSIDADLALEGLEELKEEHGIDLRADVAAFLGGEAAFALDGPVLPIPSWKLVVEVYDPYGLQETIERALDEANACLVEDGQPVLELERTEWSGHTFYAIRHLESGFSVHYLITEGYLVAAPSRALLVNALKYRRTGATLANSSVLQNLLPYNDYADCSAFFYRNLQPYADLVPLSNLSGSEQEAVREIVEAAGPSLVCAYGQESRIVVSGTGPSWLRMIQALGLPALFSNSAGLEP